MQNELVSKFSNIYIMLLYSITTNDIDRVKHFLSEQLYQKYKNIIDQNKKNNELQMYDELNVAKIEMIDKKIIEDKEIITVRLISKYIDYIIDKTTGNYKRGNNKSRTQKTNILIFEKKKNKVKRKIIFTCPNCGANLDINFTGKCSYCNQTINLKNNDYILTSITEE